MVDAVLQPIDATSTVSPGGTTGLGFRLVTVGSNIDYTWVVSSPSAVGVAGAHTLVTTAAPNTLQIEVRVVARDVHGDALAPGRYTIRLEALQGSTIVAGAQADLVVADRTASCLKITAIPSIKSVGSGQADIAFDAANLCGVNLEVRCTVKSQDGRITFATKEVSISAGSAATVSARIAVDRGVRLDEFKNGIVLTVEAGGVETIVAGADIWHKHPAPWWFRLWGWLRVRRWVGRLAAAFLVGVIALGAILDRPPPPLPPTSTTSTLETDATGFVTDTTQPSTLQQSTTSGAGGDGTDDETTAAPDTTGPVTTTREAPVELVDLAVTVTGGFNNATIQVANAGQAIAQNVKITSTAEPESGNCVTAELEAIGPQEGLAPGAGFETPAAEPAFPPGDDVCFSGAYTLTAIVSSDGPEEEESNNTVTVRLEAPPNDPPVAFDASATVGCSPVTIRLQGSDPNGDPLEFGIEALPQLGTLDTFVWLGDTEISAVYTPPPGEGTLSDTFTFSVSDGEFTDTGTVQINGACIE